MSFDKESVPKLELLPRYANEPVPLTPLSYRQLISWLYHFPQALGVYLDYLTSSSDDRDISIAKQSLLNTLTERAIFVGVTLFWLMSFFYSAVRIAWSGDGELVIDWLAASIVVTLMLGSVGLFTIQSGANREAVFMDGRLTQFQSFIITNILGIILFGFLLFIFFFDPALAPSPTLPFMIYMATFIGFILASTTRIFLRSQEAVLMLRTISKVTRAILVLVIFLLLGSFFANIERVLLFVNVLIQNPIPLFIFVLVYVFGVWRPDDWLIAQRLYAAQEPKSDEIWPIPHVTLLHYKPIAKELNWQFKTDWKQGLTNSFAIVQASYQKQYVQRLIRKFLKNADKGAKKEEIQKIVEQAMTLAESDWPESLFFLLAPDTDKPFRQPLKKKKSTRSLKSLKDWRTLMMDLLKGKPPAEKKPKPLIPAPKPKFMLNTDSLTRAAMAGIWHMQHMNPAAAEEAFGQVQGSDYGKELLGLAESFKELTIKQNLANNPELKLAKKPEKPKHEEAWKALDLINETVRLAWVYKQCRQIQPAQHHGQIYQKLLENVQKIRDNQEFKSTEEAFLHELASKWEEQFRESFWGNRDPKLEPIGQNPYIYAEAPGDSRVFVGRKQQLGQLKAAWRTENFQNVLIHGQPRTGKTTLLYKADADLKDVELVHINLAQTSANAGNAGLAELFMDITSGLGKLLSQPAPDFRDMLHSPMRTFREYIYACSEQVGNTSLVIVLDNFEHIDKILPFVEQRNRVTYFLMHITRQIQNVGLACVVTTTPEEFGSKFENEFAASLTPIYVGNFQIEKERGDVERLFRNPAPKFLPYCLPEAIERIWELTDGNPYLLQLLGHYIVQIYNQEIAEKNDKIKKKAMKKEEQRDPVFTVSDIEAAANHAEFKTISQRYIVDLLQQVGAITTLPAEQAILPRGKSAREVNYKQMLQRIARSGAPLPAKQKKVEKVELAGLLRHKVIVEKNGQITIPVELLRTWLVDNEL